jgi:hypothetical protein
VVMNDSILLSCFVNNFDLHFTKNPYNKEITKTYRLKNETDVSKIELNEVLEFGFHQPVFRIKKSSTDLYLIGYNYFNEDDIEHPGLRYPIFAKHKPKIFFEIEFTVKLTITEISTICLSIGCMVNILWLPSKN